jgi:hypothetical protein
MKWDIIKAYLLMKEKQASYKKAYKKKKDAKYTTWIVKNTIAKFDKPKHFNWGIFIRQSISAIIALCVILPLIKSVRSNVTAAGGNVPSGFDMIITAFPFVIIAIIIGAILQGFQK